MTQHELLMGALPDYFNDLRSSATSLGYAQGQRFPVRVAALRWAAVGKIWPNPIWAVSLDRELSDYAKEVFFEARDILVMVRGENWQAERPEMTVRSSRGFDLAQSEPDHCFGVFKGVCPQLWTEDGSDTPFGVLKSMSAYLNPQASLQARTAAAVIDQVMEEEARNRAKRDFVYQTPPQSGSSRGFSNSHPRNDLPFVMPFTSNLSQMSKERLLEALSGSAPPPRNGWSRGPVLVGL